MAATLPLLFVSRPSPLIPITNGKDELRLPEIGGSEVYSYTH